MKSFSLKLFLIGLCLLGAFVGMMGNWLIRSPETFFVAVTICSTVVPFVLATGTIIWMGARRERRPGLIAWGALLLLLPVLVQGSVALFVPSRDPLRILSTERLIETRLPNGVNQPWIWNELERRLAEGDLSRAEVDAALSKLIEFMKSSKPQGWNQPLAWQDDFIKSAVQAKMMSEATFLALCDAFYGAQPVVSSVPPIDAGDAHYSLKGEFGNPWSDQSGLGVELLWHVTAITVDEELVLFRQRQSFGRIWNGTALKKVEPGEHEVTLEFECAYVDRAQLPVPMFDAPPVELWPPAYRRWKAKVSIPVKVDERK